MWAKYIMDYNYEVLLESSRTVIVVTASVNEDERGGLLYQYAT
jgi:hypothetical protein